MISDVFGELKGRRRHDVRIINGKPHLCTTIGGIITKDLGEYDNKTKKICGLPYYTEDQLTEKYNTSDEFFKENIIKEEREILKKERQKREREYEARIKREVKELTLREEQARIRKMEIKIENSRIVTDKELTEIPKEAKEEVKEEAKEEVKEEAKEEVKEEAKEEVKEEVKLKEYISPDKMAEERDRKLALVHEGHSVDVANEIIKLERKEGKIMVEKRVVCGKARSVRFAGGKISQVYDDDMREWLSKDEFNERYGTNEDKNVEVEAPKITVTTATSGIGSSGTATMIPDIKTNMVSVPDADKIEEKKVNDKKVENKSEKKVEYANIIDEYVSLLYMNEK